MAADTKRVLQRDARDGWNRVVRWMLALPLAVYSASFVFDKHKLTYIRVPTLDGGTRDILYAHAKDGLIVPVLQTMDSKWPEGDWSIIDFHAVAAMVLMLAVLFQKQSVKWMLENYGKWVFYHRWVGRVSLGLVAIMCWYGYEMSKNINLEHFDIFIYVFIAPFATFSVLLYLTASPKYIVYHRIFANMLFKGVVGTPLARVAGMILQSLAESPSAWATDYYLGIGFVATILGLWQVAELVWFFVVERRLEKADDDAESKKAKKKA